MVESRLLLRGRSWGLESVSRTALVFWDKFLVLEFWLETNERHVLGYHQKIRVHTAGGRVMREHVDCPIDISGDYELPQSLLFLLALVGFAK